MISEILLHLLEDISNAFVLSDAEGLIQQEGLRCSSFRARQTRGMSSSNDAVGYLSHLSTFNTADNNNYYVV